MNAEVRNNPTEYRYELWADGELAGYAQYVLHGERIAFVHTEVYQSYEGLGLGGRLARAALDDARAQGLVVMPFSARSSRVSSSAISISTVTL